MSIANAARRAITIDRIAGPAVSTMKDIGYVSNY